MPKLIFTQSEIDDILKERKEAKHHFYDQTVETADRMKVHADGIFPKTLLEERRPNEPLEVKEYREKIWVPITKPTFSKVFSSLQKIRRSSDWAVKFDGLEEFTKINEMETIQKYTEEKFPYFTSVTNWAFSLLLRKYLIDPNALVFVIPLEAEIPENEYLRPFPVVFDSVDALQFFEEDYAILNNPLGAVYKVKNGEELGRSYYFITTQQILKYDQIDSKNNFRLTMQYDHGLGVLPVYKIKGILIDQADNQFLYESRIAGMLPELEEAVREYSDLQAAKVMHIYPERWEYTNNECLTCKGTGRRTNAQWFEGCAATIEPTTTCDTCSGRGYTVSGPYSKIMVKPPNALEPGAQIPTPPAGYVEKDVEIIKIQQEGVDKHVYKALASINFEFLEKTPLAESGISKEVDKDELNNTVHSVAEDIIAAMDRYYRLAAYYRYKSLYSLEEIDEMLPRIPVPEKYDILSPQHLGEELEKHKQGKTNPVILNQLEVEYASKRFNVDPQVRDRVALILELDPLPNISEDDKMSRLTNKGITLETYVISSNIQEFVQRALSEDPDFADKELEEQKAKMLEYAEQEIEKNDEAAKAAQEAMQEMNDQGGLGEVNNDQSQAAA
jgi:hypothetical protein